MTAESPRQSDMRRSKRLSANSGEPEISGTFKRPVSLDLEIEILAVFEYTTQKVIITAALNEHVSRRVNFSNFSISTQSEVESICVCREKYLRIKTIKS
jgi:hypothetical protein